jgi:hypothetical protein
MCAMSKTHIRSRLTTAINSQSGQSYKLVPDHVGHGQERCSEKIQTCLGLQILHLGCEVNIISSTNCNNFLWSEVFDLFIELLNSEQVPSRTH